MSPDARYQSKGLCNLISKVTGMIKNFNQWIIMHVVLCSRILAKSGQCMPSVKESNLRVWMPKEYIHCDDRRERSFRKYLENNGQGLLLPRSAREERKFGTKGA